MESNVWYVIVSSKEADSLWTDLINIFEVFLPQLLRYPNPTDPLNGEAAALLMREAVSYDSKVKGVLLFQCRYSGYLRLSDYVKKYATKEAYEAAADESDGDDEMSSIEAFSDEEAAGDLEL